MLLEDIILQVPVQAFYRVPSKVFCSCGPPSSSLTSFIQHYFYSCGKQLHNQSLPCSFLCMHRNIIIYFILNLFATEFFSGSMPLVSNLLQVISVMVLTERSHIMFTITFLLLDYTYIIFTMKDMVVSK